MTAYSPRSLEPCCEPEWSSISADSWGIWNKAKAPPEIDKNHRSWCGSSSRSSLRQGLRCHGFFWESDPGQPWRGEQGDREWEAGWGSVLWAPLLPDSTEAHLPLGSSVHPAGGLEEKLCPSYPTVRKKKEGIICPGCQSPMVKGQCPGLWPQNFAQDVKFQTLKQGLTSKARSGGRSQRPRPMSGSSSHSGGPHTPRTRLLLQ